MIKIEHMPCLVVGGGKIALRKALGLLRFHAKVTVVSPEINRGLRKLLQRERISWRKKRFSIVDLWRQKLVVAATDDQGANRRIGFWASKFRILFNSVDDLGSSGFIFPAIHKTGVLTLSVSTQGYCPGLARKVKQELACHYRPDYGDYIRKISRIRENLRAREPDFQKRRQILKRIINLDMELLLSFDEAKIKELLSDV
jgi:siroheme synthase-like protein